MKDWNTVEWHILQRLILLGLHVKASHCMQASFQEPTDGQLGPALCPVLVILKTESKLSRKGAVGH